MFDKISGKLYQKSVSAIRTIPTLKSWLISFLLLLGIALICLPIGFQSRLLELKILHLSFIGYVKVLISRFFFPCFAEELLYRVLMLPREARTTPRGVQIAIACVSIVLYVIGHPLNAFFFYKKAFDIFTNPVFLLSTLVLGIACTISYFQSRSIWTPIAIHWIVVVTWLLVLDGHAKLKLRI